MSAKPLHGATPPNHFRPQAQGLRREAINARLKAIALVATTIALTALASIVLQSIATIYGPLPVVIAIAGTAILALKFTCIRKMIVGPFVYVGDFANQLWETADAYDHAAELARIQGNQNSNRSKG